MTGPEGQALGRAESLTDDEAVVAVDLDRCGSSTARRLFFGDRRSELDPDWL